MKRAIRRVFITVLSVSMIGCATIPAGTQPSAQDPWESFNRSVFIFNEGLDNYLLKPVTTGYRYVVPSVARDGINNFFGNYNDIYSSLNQLLQGNPGLAAKGLMRVVVNTVFGLGGLIDMATPGGLPNTKPILVKPLGFGVFHLGLMWCCHSSGRARSGIPLVPQRILKAITCSAYCLMSPCEIA